MLVLDGKLRTELGFQLDRLLQALVCPLSNARGQALLEFSQLIAVAVSEPPRLCRRLWSEALKGPPRT